MAFRFVTVPIETEVVVTVRRTLENHADLAELFRVDDVLLDSDTMHLRVIGRGSARYHAEKGQERVLHVVSEIPLVRHHVRQIAVEESAADHLNSFGQLSVPK